MASKKKELTIADKLNQLADLQAIHSKIDEIEILKGELPIEVADLEDEIAGMETRLAKIQRDIADAENEITEKRNAIKDSQNMIAKYDKQLNTVKNNREFDALSKEIENQKLDIQLCERRIREGNTRLEAFAKQLTETEEKIQVKAKELGSKKDELGKIIAETEKEEKDLTNKAAAVEAVVEERLITAYKRIRRSYKNGLAVVQVVRNACGGCFGRIPPQTQSEIRQKKKVITCEHCGRILVDVLDRDDDNDDLGVYVAE